MKERILIVEDDRNISKLLKYNLENSGYECIAAFNAEKALQVIDESPVDLLILDIMLPGMDGLDLCRAIKGTESSKTLPIIIVTARGEEVDKIVGLELGADDYIVKPFSPRELLLRIRAVLKRSEKEKPKNSVLTAGDICIDTDRHKVTVKGKSFELTHMEFKLLFLLIERRGRVQSRDQLLRDVWEMEAGVDTRTVDTHIKRLREKLGRYGDLIETVRGFGYRLNDDGR